MPPSDQFSIERVAELARIDIPQDESAQIQEQISKILEFVNVLDELELDQVQPFFGLDLAGTDAKLSPLREDSTRDSTSRETILQNAPKVGDGEFYQVPPVF